MRRHSSLARIGAALTAAALVFVTLNPFADWRNIGIAPWAFLRESWPRYWTWFDLLTNAAAYAPLGLLGALAVYPRIRAWAAFALVTVLASALSLSLEALQTYLPARIASWLDWLANSVGAALGAAIGALAASWLIERSALRMLRDRWFVPHAALGLTLLITWVLVQAYPQPMLMATGRVLQPLALLAGAAPGAAVLLAPRYFVLIEALGVAAASTAVALILLDIARPTAPRTLLTVLALGAALAVKSLATAWLLGEAESLHWLSSGAQGGLVFAALMIAALSATAPQRRLTAALIALLLALALANFAPENAYYEAMLGRWDQGAWINFNRLLSATAIAWPFVALVYLLYRRRRASS